MGGGGGSSGAVSWPEYLMGHHAGGIAGLNFYLDSIHSGIEGSGDGPYSLAVYPSPTTWLNSLSTAIDAYSTSFGYYQPDKVNPFWTTIFEYSVEAFDDNVNDDYIDEDMTDAFIEEAYGDVDDSYYEGALDDDFMHSAMEDMDDSFIEAVTDDTFIADSAEAHQEVLEDQLDLVTLPEYKGSMRTLGAVESSAYAVGEAVLRNSIAKDVAKYAGDLKNELTMKRVDLRSQMLQIRTKLRADIIAVRAKMKADIMSRRVQIRGDMLVVRNKLRGEFYSERLKSITANVNALISFTNQYLASMANLLDNNFKYSQLGIVSKAEEYEANLSYVLHDWTWHIDLFQYHANYLGALGGAAMPVPTQPNETRKTVSNIASGASLGYQMGGGYGALAGAAIGGIYSMFD